MQGSQSLEQRLAAYSARRPRPGTRAAFERMPRQGLRSRLDERLDAAIAIFELDRLLYDIEVDAQQEWLARLVAFDAYCARRDAAGGGASAPPVR
jgi:hypothetical protein